MSGLVAAASPSPLWYLTRGTGVVALLLLTASVLLGIAASTGWKAAGWPRFLSTGLHRNLTLLSVAFVGAHVVTTVADSYTPIGLKDAIVPFTSSYRPFWLGLGAVAFDLLIALVVTSLLRLRLGHRRWRAVHWLAYACWPVALVHALGTGSDARFGWLAVVAIASTVAVAAAAIRRLAAGWADRTPLRAGGALAALGVPLLILVWWASGPRTSGWAAHAGTPRTLLASSVAAIAAPKTAPRPARPRRVAISSPLPSPPFNAPLSGKIAESTPDGNGLVTVRIDAATRGPAKGVLQVILQGEALGDGGVSMTASRVTFGTAGNPAAYSGPVVRLDGPRISASLSNDKGARLALTIRLRIDRQTNVVTGSVRAVRSAGGPRA